MKRNFRILIEYDGTDFHGWQRQRGMRTVQGEIEEALEKITGEKVKIVGAGRTDAGVHALGQVASFTLEECDAPPDKLLSGMNALTGDDVTIKNIEEVPLEFCARKNVLRKTYCYRIQCGSFPSPLMRMTHLHVASPLDIEKMRAAAKNLEGRHDFSAFRASDCTDPDPVRTILSCTVTEDGKEITIEVVSKGFLKNMVRIVAGTLIQAGRSRILPGDIPAILDSRDRRKAGPTAPPHGLVLVKVEYHQ